MGHYSIGHVEVAALVRPWQKFQLFVMLLPVVVVTFPLLPPLLDAAFQRLRHQHVSPVRLALRPPAGLIASLYLAR